MNKQRQREIEILEFLKRINFATVKEIADEVQVSEMTVRRSLKQLQNEDLLKLIHGGAILNNNVPKVDKEHAYSLLEEGSANQEQKIRIGQKAASIVEPNDIIIIDSGTTTEYLAHFIPDDFPLTILCYTMNVLFEVYKRKSSNIIFAGGHYHPNTMMFESSEGIQLIKHLRANKVFIGATGINRNLGVTCSNSCEPEVKRAALNSSLTRILLADSSKFGKVKTCYFAEIAEFDTIVTDDGSPGEYLELLQQLGKTVLVV
jgi:DeoR family deoxyribose operon repressor